MLKLLLLLLEVIPAAVGSYLIGSDKSKLSLFNIVFNHEILYFMLKYNIYLATNRKHIAIFSKTSNFVFLINNPELKKQC